MAQLMQIFREEIPEHPSKRWEAYEQQGLAPSAVPYGKKSCRTFRSAWTFTPQRLF